MLTFKKFKARIDKLLNLKYEESAPKYEIEWHISNGFHFSCHLQMFTWFIEQTS